MRKKFAAFTLVEMVIVIAMLAIVSVIGIASTQPAQRFDDAKDTVRRSETEALAKAMRIYYLDNNFTYPPTNTGGQINVITRSQFQTLLAQAQAGTAVCSGTQAADISNAIQPYYNSVPVGPDGNNYYVFRVEDLFVVSCADLSTGNIYARIE